MNLKKKYVKKIFFNIVTLFEGTKILELKQYQKSDKAPFVIYADLEFIIKKKGGCKGWLHKTILGLNHFFQISRAFALFYVSIFKTTFSFLFNITLKTYPSSSVHRMKLPLYIKTKSDNHVILQIKLLFQSKSSNGNNFIVLFKIGLPHFINKLSLSSNLNLLQSVAKMLKSSDFMAQLHCNRW